MICMIWWVGGWLSSDYKANLSPADLATASRCLTGLGWAWQFKMNSQYLQCSSLWNFFHPLQFVIKSVPSMCSLFNLLLSLKKETTLLFMLSVINKLSTLTAPSMIDFFFTNINLSNMTKLTLLDSLLQEVTVTEIQIATCLIRPSLHCLIHFSKRCVSSVNS